MKTLTTTMIALVLLTSCSKGEVKAEATPYDFMIGKWTYTDGEFTGNGKTGIVDPFFNNMVMPFKAYPMSGGTIYHSDFKYPNGAQGIFSVLVSQNDLAMTSLADKGIKSSDATTTNLEDIELLVDSDGNTIEVIPDNNGYTMDLSHTENTMDITKIMAGYTIIYHFVK